MKFAPIAVAAAALLSLQTPSEAATFQSVSGTGFTTETTSVTNLYTTPLAPAGSSVVSYSVLSTAAWLSEHGDDQLCRAGHVVHVPVGLSGFVQPGD